MKKMVLLLALLCLSTLAFPKGRMQVTIDYTNGVYRGFLYDGIIMVEEDFLKDKPRYEGRFLDEFLQYFSGIAYFPTEIDESDDIVSISILNVSKKGDVTAQVTYGDQTIKMQGKGGVFGSFLNLFGDGMNSLGKNVALWLNSIILPAK